jgi:hypothetical protein
MFTFIPVWIIQDVLIILATIIAMIFIVKNEKHPEIILLEMICFCLLYAAVYENFATLVGYYGYGRSIIMIFNVPLTVPLIEFLVVYTTIRILSYMDIPSWCKPFIVGLSGMMFDFTLDPIAIKQVFTTDEGIIGRWTWFIGLNDVNIYGEPVYNFTGWVLLCGYAALFLLIGRAWYKRSGYKPIVGYLYPVLAMLGALILLVIPPISRFLLWLDPLFSVGSIGEWIMLGLHSIISISLLIFIWRGKMKSGFSIQSEYPAFLILIIFHFIDIIFTLIGGYWEIIWLQILFTMCQGGLILYIYLRGKSVKI